MFTTDLVYSQKRFGPLHQFQDMSLGHYVLVPLFQDHGNNMVQKQSLVQNPRA